MNSWCGSEVYLYGSGGGTSRIFAEPSYQQGVVPDSLATRWSTSFPGRVLPDIAAVGDPNTGLIGQTQAFSNGTYYDEYRIGGTSISSIRRMNVTFTLATTPEYRIPNAPFSLFA